MATVIAYVDGFNLYHGLHQAYGRRYLWLDLEHLVQRVRPHDQILAVRYFTAEVRDDPDGLARQRAYLAALKAKRRRNVRHGYPPVVPVRRQELVRLLPRRRLPGRPDARRRLRQRHSPSVRIAVTGQASPQADISNPVVVGTYGWPRCGPSYSTVQAPPLVRAKVALNEPACGGGPSGPWPAQSVMATRTGRAGSRPRAAG
jgi:hypothetical protein